MTNRRGPIVIDPADLGDAPFLTPADAPPVPDPVGEAPQGRAMQQATRIVARPFGWLSRLFWIALTGLISLMISLAAWDFAWSLFARNIWLGRTALGLGAVVLSVLVLVALRELAAIARLSRVDRLQRDVRVALSSQDLAAARTAARALERLYSGREELRWGRADLAERRGEVMDADGLLALVERSLMQPLDDLARREVAAAARQVAATTALIPLALADVTVALVANIRMVRRVAEVYGGRAGTFGSLRLLRAVAAHLLATGAVAVGDDLIGSAVGGGALSKVSRRFGEGVVNGALTARVGIAAMEVCRPMPFTILPRPRVSGLVKRALAGLFSGQ